eukprot:7042902-Prymnesium_polylepis.1
MPSNVGHVHAVEPVCDANGYEPPYGSGSGSTSSRLHSSATPTPEHGICSPSSCSRLPTRRCRCPALDGPS